MTTQPPSAASPLAVQPGAYASSDGREQLIILTERLHSTGFRVLSAGVIAWFCLRESALHESARRTSANHESARALSDIAATWLERLPRAASWTVAAGAALLVVLGVQTRLAALVLLALLAWLRPGAASAGFDAPLVSLFALCLLLIPDGRRRPLARGSANPRVESLAVPLMLGHVAFIYGNFGFWLRNYAAWRFDAPVCLAVAMLPACMLLSVRSRSRVLVAAVQFGLNLWLAVTSGHWVGNMLLASSALLWTRDATWLGAEGSQARTMVLDTRAALALAFTLVVSVFLVAQLVHVHDPLEAAGTVLGGLGPLVESYLLAGHR